MPRLKKTDEFKKWLLEQRSAFVFRLECTAYVTHAVVIGTDKEACEKQLKKEHKGMQISLVNHCHKVTLNG